MSWLLESFGTAPISAIAAVQDISTFASVLPSIATSNGEQYDQLGTDERANPAPTTIQAKGEFVVDTVLEKTILTRVWAALRGKRDRLFRVEDGTGERDWIWARLNKVTMAATPETTLVQPFTLEFKLYSSHWFGRRRGVGWTLNSGVKLNTGYSLNQSDRAVLLAGGLTTIVYTDAGDTDVDDPIVRITNPAGGTGITHIALTAGPDASTTEVTWAYNATLAANHTLVVDCGDFSVLDNSVDAYNSLVTTANAIDPWLRMYAGSTTIKITLTGGGSGGNAASVTVEYAEGKQ